MSSISRALLSKPSSKKDSSLVSSTSKEKNSRKNLLYKAPTTRYYKTLIYNSPIYKSNSYRTFSNLDRLSTTITILDLNLFSSSKYRDDSYLRSLIRRYSKIPVIKEFLLRLRYNSLLKNYSKIKGVYRALFGKNIIFYSFIYTNFYIELSKELYLKLDFNYLNYNSLDFRIRKKLFYTIREIYNYSINLGLSSKLGIYFSINLTNNI